MAVKLLPFQDGKGWLTLVLTTLLLLQAGRAFGVDAAADLRVAHQTVFHDGARPSRIVLPLAPAAADA
jgi:hypothetical protein